MSRYRVPVYLWYVLNEPEPGCVIETYNHYSLAIGDQLVPEPKTEAEEKAWRGRRWARKDGFIDERGEVLD